MLRAISLRKIMQFPKLKLKNNGRVYDKEWHTWFSCEEERQEFKVAIETAENDQLSYNQEQMEEILYNEFGIELK